MNRALVWFRRDLRMRDNAALSHALRDAGKVCCAFCFDTAILNALEDKADRRVEFIHQSVAELRDALRNAGGDLIVRHGDAREEIPKLADDLKVEAVFTNRDYEPACIERDLVVEKRLAADGRGLRTFKDHVIFEKDEVLTKSGGVYGVYTPYKNAWRARLTGDDLAEYEISRYRKNLATPPSTVRSSRWRLGDMGFEKTDLRWPGGRQAGRKTFDDFLTRIERYGRDRDYPEVNGTSRLSVHMRFGTVSIREIVHDALDHGSPGAQKWVDEIIWREFYAMLLAHYPHIVTQPYQEKFKALKWRASRKDFEAWCEGRTGYPLVDAGMRQLNQTGYMHNRLRMISAGFLTKDLRIHWKQGERYFARKLLDYDMSQNIGGWQWSASIGTDAQSWFRIFNPVSQSRKFDAEGNFIRRFVPELARYDDKGIHAPWEVDADTQRACGCIIGKDYPAPIVDHAEAREKALAMYKAVSVGV